MNILSRVSFDHVICMFPFLFCRSHSKIGAVNQIIHPGFHKSLTTDYLNVTAQKINSSIKDFFSKWDQIRSFLRIWSHLMKKSLMENFIFCAVCVSFNGWKWNAIYYEWDNINQGCSTYLANIYLFKVNNRNTGKRSLTTSLTSFWCFYCNFEHISHLFLVFLLLTLNK